jgi:hypothetical protein
MEVNPLETELPGQNGFWNLATMALFDRRTARVLLTIALFAVAVGIVYSARRVFVVFFFAILFAYVLDPVVKFLQRHSFLFRNLRGPAVVEAYLGFLVLVAVLLRVTVPGALRAADRLFDEVPPMLDAISSGEIATQVGDNYGWSEAQKAHLKPLLASHREDVQSLVRGADRYASDFPAVVAWLALTPLLAIFFLRDGPRIANALIGLASAGGHYEAVQGRRRGASDPQEVHQGESDPRRAFGIVLLNIVAAFPFSTRDYLGPDGGSSGGHTCCRLDGDGSRDHRRWGSDSLPLDLDGRAAGRLAAASRLLHLTSGHGARAGNSSADDDFWGNGGLAGWRNCRNLSFGAVDCHDTRRMAQIRREQGPSAGQTRPCS